MTYAETKTLMDAIHEVETWTRAIEREWAKENTDFKQVAEYEAWLDTAKQKIFDIANR